MKILVTFASKHGSTYEIAEAIGSELATPGQEGFRGPTPTHQITMPAQQGLGLNQESAPSGT